MPLTQQRLETVFERRFDDAKDNWKGNCPFHDERSPSFYVHKENYVAHCFGCGIAGSIDVLAGQFLKSDKYKARELLGLETNDFLQSTIKRANPSSRRDPTFFSEAWLAAWPREAHLYTIRRGITIEALKAARARYDPVLRRQVFPHYSGDDLLGAAGRAVLGDAPKWHFYWNYDKGAALWVSPPPPEEASDTALRPLILVEGIFDALALWQNGVYNVRALLGSHATKLQLEEIRQHREVWLMLDNDEAGRAGQEKIFREIHKSSYTLFFDWPDHCNDAMDLTQKHYEHFNEYWKNQLQRKLNVQRKTIQNSGPSSRVSV